MKDKFQYIFAIMVGAFALHCSQSAMHAGNGDGGGGITDARGDTGTCCAVQPQTFKLIGEGDVAMTYNTSFQTPTFDASQYRELIVSITSSGTGCYVGGTSLVFQEPGSSVFISTNQATGRVRVDGPTAKITGYPGNSSACTGTAHYVVAGVALN